MLGNIWNECSACINTFMQMICLYIESGESRGISINTTMQILSNFASSFCQFFLTFAGGNVERIRNDVGTKFLREDVQSFFDTLRFEVEFFPSLLPHFLYGGGDHTLGKIYLISLPRDFAKIFYNPCDSWSLINDKNLIPRGSFRQQCRRGSSIRLSDATLKDNAWNSPQRKFLNVD